jgi:mannose-1-phosphate guanylyltransferase
MKIVLLSGGSGKRLWPLSNDSRSKQFLKVLRNADQELESMVQRVWSQLRTAKLDKDAYIATGRGQVEMIQSQIGLEAPIIVEPERRDTFPAIALAATYLYSMESVSLNEVVAVLPVDPFVEDAFFAKIKELEAIVHHSDAQLALMGVRPTCPSEKFGYIVPRPDESVNDNPYMTVSHFTEKPREDKAIQLLEQQALWNCGVFAFKLDFLINLLIEKGFPIQYEEMLKKYHTLPQISFDYEVVEKAASVVVTPFDGLWKDLGTWNTLTEEVGENTIGNGTISADSVNTHLINELDIPIAVLGLSNVIISASPDGILVADKNSSPKVKELIKHIEQRPMYEERRWGMYRVLDYKKLPGGNEVLTKRIFIGAGKNLSYQLHEKRSEIWTIISGFGDLMLNGRLYKVAAGDVVKIEVGSKHSIRAQDDLEIIEVQTGTELVEEDIVRLCMSWEEIVEQAVI